MNYFLSVASCWLTDYRDYKAIVVLSEKKKDGTLKQLGSFTVSYSPDEIKQVSLNYSEDISENEIKDALLFLTSKDLEDTYLKLPFISKCSNLLQDIFENVCISESSMCHIDYEQWNEFYLNDGYSEDDVNNLKYEIEEYGLDDVIEINTKEDKIVAYSDLETRFFDDSKTSKKKEIEYDDLTVLLIQVNELPRVISIKNTLKEMQRLVDGYIEIFSPFDDNTCIVCNEDGKILSFLANRLIKKDKEVLDTIYGDFFIVGSDEEEFKSLTEEQIKSYSKLFDETSIEEVNKLYYGNINKKQGRSL